MCFHAAGQGVPERVGPERAVRGDEPHARGGVPRVRQGRRPAHLARRVPRILQGPLGLFFFAVALVYPRVFSSPQSEYMFHIVVLSSRLCNISLANALIKHQRASLKYTNTIGYSLFCGYVFFCQIRASRSVPL